jgi:uncharacterized protein YcbX
MTFSLTSLFCSRLCLLLLCYIENGGAMQVISLSRFAVKGLGPDCLEEVCFEELGDTFPDDRRYALLESPTNPTQFDPQHPEWLHKDNFLCAFTAPELLARYITEYSSTTEGKRLLTVWKRDATDPRKREDQPLLGPVDLGTECGRTELGQFFSHESGRTVECVSAQSQKHEHQFGNTRSGVRERGDTRTVHLINAATVRDISDKLKLSNSLNPLRFRPNIVVDYLEPWSEFDLVGKTIQCESSGLQFDIISRTVRCAGVGIDPLDPETGNLDIPQLLQENFPQHGPYLGVYAVVSSPGNIRLGDTLSLAEN